MEGVLELLPTVADGKPISHLQTFLEACEEHIAFHDKVWVIEVIVKLFMKILSVDDCIWYIGVNTSHRC